MKKQELLELSDIELNKVVKIKGTKFDRRQKYTDKQIKKMQKLYKKGYSISDICLKLGCTYNTAKCYCVPGFREKLNKGRDGKVYNRQITFRDRAEYKRQLIKKNLIKGEVKC